MFNHYISSLGTSLVTDMKGMFCESTTFNQDISSWDKLSVTNMYEMFEGATAFKQNISSWDTSLIRNRDYRHGYVQCLLRPS